jgi:hypothetical protein
MNKKFWLVKNGVVKIIPLCEAKELSDKHDENFGVDTVICYAKDEFEAIFIVGLYDHEQIGMDNQNTEMGVVICLINPFKK